MRLLLFHLIQTVSEYCIATDFIHLGRYCQSSSAFEVKSLLLFKTGNVTIVDTFFRFILMLEGNILHICPRTIHELFSLVSEYLFLEMYASNHVLYPADPLAGVCRQH